MHAIAFLQGICDMGAALHSLPRCQSLTDSILGSIQFLMNNITCANHSSQILDNCGDRFVNPMKLLSRKN